MKWNKYGYRYVLNDEIPDLIELKGFTKSLSELGLFTSKLIASTITERWIEPTTHITAFSKQI